MNTGAFSKPQRRLMQKPNGNSQTRKFLTCIFFLLFAIGQWISVCQTSGDDATFKRKGKKQKLNGQIILTGDDGSALFQTPDGRLWVLQANELGNLVDNETHPVPLKNKELGKQLLEELPDGFKIHHAGNWVIAYSTETNYARWVGGLYNRLDRNFEKYWAKRKFKTKKPDFPLAVIIFGTRAEYDRYMKNELGVVAPALVAYYHLLSNRVAMFDLTSDKRFKAAGRKRTITDVLANPQALPMIATVIHEATHQLMFNNGMQVRMSDTPLWVNEGLAMYFETPDLKNSRGWRKIGEVNPMRLVDFLRSIPRRPPDALVSMLTSPDRFRDPKTGIDAYAEAWAFSYFLLEKHEKEFVNYLKFLSEKPQQEFDSKETRLKEFKKFLGEDLRALEIEFLSFIETLR